MSLSFSTYDFITTFIDEKYVSNLPFPVYASVKIHLLIVGQEDTEFKWNKNRTISCESKQAVLSLWMKIYFVL